MANTYTQLYIHYIFAVKDRLNLIDPQNNDELQKYITGIITNNKSKLIAINNMPDHMHILLGIHPSISVSNIIQDIKASSSKFINEKFMKSGKFAWQEGYCALSYSKSQLDNVIKYIQNQQEHHKTKTFKNEYVEILEKMEIEINEKYIYEFYE